MKKVSVLVLAVLAFCLTAGISSGKMPEAWNLNERIHPDVAQSFLASPEFSINAETLPDIRKNFVKSPESLPKDDAVEAYNEMITSALRVRVYKPKSEQKDFPGLLWLHGGGLAAAVALRARDSGGPAVCFQMLLYPMLDCRNNTPSMYQITDHRVWCRDFNLFA